MLQSELEATAVYYAYKQEKGIRKQKQKIVYSPLTIFENP